MNHNGVPIIGEHRVEHEDLSSEQRDRLAQMAAEHGELPKARVFLVIVPDDGDAMATPDLTAAGKYDVSPPTVAQIASACRAIYDDVQASKAAHMTLALQQQVAAAAMQQAQNQEILRNMQRGDRG